MMMMIHRHHLSSRRLRTTAAEEFEFEFERASVSLFMYNVVGRGDT